ncbi:NRPS-like enzyme [Penicillium longicatenatum]|nr:NRPS-like enzyme [Penicillium longicatenatum]
MTASAANDFNPCTQLIPNVIDHYARVLPNAIYAEYPVSSMSYEDGYRPVTYKALGNAINGIATWLTANLGPGNGEILPYVGPNDVRYPALVLGAIKAGYCMFLTSPRNSAVAHQSLLKKLGCTTLICPTPRPAPVNVILNACSLNVLEVLSVDELMSTQYPDFPFSKTWPDAATETLVVLHTSGSTGIPKPIFWTHDTACKHMEMVVLPPPHGYESQDHWNFGKRMYLVPPPFHAAGVAYLHYIGLSVGISLIAPTSGGLPTAASLVEARKKTNFETALIVPSIVQELAQSPELLDYVSRNLTHLVYCGGDLPQQIGDAVAAKIKLVNQYGASEVGMMPSVHSTTNRDPFKDWRYIDFHPRMGVELQHVSDGEYELVVVRRPDYEPQQFSFTIFPDRQQYHTSDLFVQHPDPAKADLWRWCARADDIIVLLNGEKTNPVSMEQHIVASNQQVTAALVAGTQRFQTSLLIELNTKEDLSLSERAAMIEKLWPSIQQANAVCPAHARIAKTHIVFTTKEMPMLRAGKGTIQRAGTLAQYRRELDKLYADADELSGDAGIGDGPGRSNDLPVVSQYIRQSILDITGWNDNLSDTENWFSLGLDSLQTITTTRVLRQGLGIPSLSPNVVYLHPTVSELANAIILLHSQGDQSAEDHQRHQLQEREELLQELLGQIKLPSSPPPRTTPTEQIVILTGSTGSLGSYILHALLQNPSVGHVHCLNRRSNASEVQSQKSKSYGLQLDHTRVSFWTADLAEPQLGLPLTTLRQLQQTATLVIHNAWAVNFNLSLRSFKPNLEGVVNLVNFSLRATYGPHLYFISSISSTMGHHTQNGLTPEDVVTTTVPAPNGYANSKYIAERLLAEVAERSSGAFHPAYSRVGQIAGPVRSSGLWNRAEWFPSLVLSSAHIGALPESLGPALDRIDWVPIDLLAEILVDLALTRSVRVDGIVAVHHPVNPNPLSWNDIRPAVVEALKNSSGANVETVTFREWLHRVRQDIEVAGVDGDKELQELLAQNPAAKLLDFFDQVMSQTYHSAL